MGAICHEYGHILGLPDLYNTDFLQRGGVADADPAEDSAGIGRWGLMGWGALGWHGDDGPVSFSVWSRVQLGWAEVRTIERPTQAIELPSIGASGIAYRIPVTHKEAFWLEYRRRGDVYYDRNTPGEGVLIWHGHVPEIGDQDLKRYQLDLECADGRWREGGFPLGQTVDALEGGDNLDFWAHDVTYTRAHGGNLGDATDLFDGARFTAFTPESNPTSHSEDGQLSIRVDSIRMVDDRVRAHVTAVPPRLSAVNLLVEGADGDPLLAAGEESEVSFGVANRGGLAAVGVRAVLQSDDPLVEILQRESHFEDLPVGGVAYEPFPDPLDLPRFRIHDDFVGTHTTALKLILYAGDEALGEFSFEATAGVAAQRIAAVTFVDSLGNGDGRAQVGEIASLAIEVADQHAEILPA